MALQPKRAISIRQPYAEQILRGIKIREYRSVPTNIRERAFIYASERPGPWFDFDLTGLDQETLPRGVLVGSVESSAANGSGKAIASLPARQTAPPQNT